MAVLEPTMDMLLDWVHPGPAPPEELEWAETIILSPVILASKI